VREKEMLLKNRGAKISNVSTNTFALLEGEINTLTEVFGGRSKPGEKVDSMPGR